MTFNLQDEGEVFVDRVGNEYVCHDTLAVKPLFICKATSAVEPRFPNGWSTGVSPEGMPTYAFDIVRKKGQNQ